MRKLHLVGLTTDRDGLIFTARKGSKSGGYIVPLDDRLLGAVADARDGPFAGTDGRSDDRGGDNDPRTGRTESALTPREMQARLRAGRTIGEVAAEAGVDSDWVARFAVPILAEQAQVVELARGLVYAKPRLGESSQPLNASVVQNLSDKGVFLPDDVADAGWSAFQLHDAVWMVRFRFRSRGRDQEAQWEIDVPAGRLLARNRLASDLGYVEEGRHRRALTPDEEESPHPVVAASPPARRASSRPRRPPLVPAPKAAPAPARVARNATARSAPAVRPPPKRAGAAPAARAVKAAPAARAVRPSKKTTAPARVVRPSKKTTAPARVAKPPSSTKGGTAKSPARRRPVKAAPAAEGPPVAGAGGVRLAVARVSTARVAASLASADRAPWAGAVPSRPGARPTLAVAQTSAAQTSAGTNGGRRSADRTSPSSSASPSSSGSRASSSVGSSAAAGAVAKSERPAADPDVPAFRPRPLPDGVHIEEPRPRRPPSTARRPPSAAVAANERPPLVLPAPRIVSLKPEPVIPPERPKRRRLRSR